MTVTVRLVREPGQRPYLENADGAHVSLAHSGGLTLVAVCAGAEIGVDLERDVDRGLRALPDHALAEEERDVLAALPASARTTALLTYWVRKEAILKAAGVGLAVEPSLITVSAPAEAPVVHAVPEALGAAGDWTLADLSVPGYVAAVAVRRPLVAVTAIES